MNSILVLVVASVVSQIVYAQTTEEPPFNGPVDGADNVKLITGIMDEMRIGAKELLGFVFAHPMSLNQDAYAAGRLIFKHISDHEVNFEVAMGIILKENQKHPSNQFSEFLGALQLKGNPKSDVKKKFDAAKVALQKHVQSEVFVKYLEGLTKLIMGKLSRVVTILMNSGLADAITGG